MTMRKLIESMDSISETNVVSDPAIVGQSVWVVLGGFDYEGWSEPLGVFSSEAAASQFIAGPHDKYDSIEAFEMVIQ